MKQSWLSLQEMSQFVDMISAVKDMTGRCRMLCSLLSFRICCIIFEDEFQDVALAGDVVGHKEVQVYWKLLQRKF